MIRVWLIDERFKVIQGNALKIGYDKKNLVYIIGELFFTSIKVDLVLEHKYT